MRISFEVSVLRHRSTGDGDSAIAQTPPTTPPPTPPDPPIETPAPTPVETPPGGPQEIPQPDPAPLPNQNPPQAQQKKHLRVMYRNRTWLICRQRSSIHAGNRVIKFKRNR